MFDHRTTFVASKLVMSIVRCSALSVSWKTFARQTTLAACPVTAPHAAELVLLPADDLDAVCPLSAEGRAARLAPTPSSISVEVAIMAREIGIVVSRPG